jgi:triacylglycerol esterase/lipase EstA (alpha/beta hydrolase family)
MRKGFELLTYSQVDAFGDIDNSAKELDIILKGIHKIYGDRRLILVGHSRGGICIRRYLDLMNNSQIEKVITLATPHKGTSFSNAPIIKQPAIKILNETALRNIWDITGKREIKDLTLQQMAVNSDYLQKLADYEKYPAIEYIAAAGVNPTFTNIYAWSARRGKQRLANLAAKLFNKNDQTKSKEKKNAKIVIENGEKKKYYHWIAYPKKIFSIFEKTILPEMISGDGFVCTKSALFEQADRQYQFEANHEEMAVCEKVKELVSKELKMSQKKK